jgi:hypothetical protein
LPDISIRILVLSVDSAFRHDRRETGHPRDQRTPQMTLADDSYDQGYQDGRHHAETGKPALSSPTRYGNGFYDGWKSIRYPHNHSTDDTGRVSTRTLIGSEPAT